MSSHALILTVILVLPASVRAASADEVAFFEKQIRPLLASRCYSCHGPKDKPKGGLRLDSVAGIRKGGKGGPVLVPGKPDSGLLVQSVKYTTDLKMPPNSKLPQAEIAMLESWVKRGAPLPDEKTESTAVTLPPMGPIRSNHWAFQPVREPTIPATRDPSEIRNPIDRFIRAKLGAKGLSPAPPATRRTLIRRATFDLTGLPPTPAEIDAYLKDSSPDAFAKVVDRLLASPAYGERWGRHWLDVARYADSNGMDENLVQANAWRYRDYVVGAFNRDLPYDQFVIDQISGDLRDNPTSDQLVATGFLSMGPKMLAEDDPVKMQMDIVDEQIDTLGRTFLGLTLGCARCHDHKFDPIPTRDYYALAGIFKSTRVMDDYKVVARWYERPVGAKPDVERLLTYRREIEAARRKLNEKTRIANEGLLATLRPQTSLYIEAARELNRRRTALSALKPMMGGKGKSEGAIVVEAENFTRGNVKKDFTVYGEKIGVIYNAGTLPNLAEYDISLARAGAYQLELRFAAADSRPVEVAINGVVVKSGAAGAVTGTWYPDTQKWSAEGVFAFVAGKNTLRLKREGPFPHFDKLALIPRESSRGASALIPMTPEQLAREHKLDAVFLEQWAKYLEKVPSPTPQAIREASQDPTGPFALPRQPGRLYPAATQDELKQLRDALTTLEKRTPILPEAMGATEGAVGNVRVHLRGHHLTLGEEVPRRFPRLLAGEGQVPIGTKTSGRRELAEWLVRPDQRLTARVLVNRVWHWHFGAGLVRTPDNFGLLGDRPAHPELLDWLSLRFVEDGWSIKALHRRIMLSATYRTSAAWDATAATRDPDNRLHWRWNRRRLDAESLRDAMLSVSGTLERTMGGSLFQGRNRGYVPGYPNGTYDRYDFPRRSVYLPVVRSMLYDVFQAFDFPDPSTPNGTRENTTIAPQALFALNGELMTKQSRLFAQTLLATAGADDARVSLGYERAFGRTATAAEATRAVEFTQRLEAEWARLGVGMAAEQRLRAWQGLCRVLLSANEFVYVE